MSKQKKTEHASESEQTRQDEGPFDDGGAEAKANRDTDAQDAGQAQQAAAQTTEHEANTPEDRIRDLEERLKRAIAEQENVRKRMEREKDDIAKYATANFAREVLGIADNIQRAINAVPQDAAEKDSALKTFLEGIEVTERELQKAMERHGIARLNPEGEKFDPNFHQAMFEVPTPDQPSGVVMQVVQPGYILGDRVLRPAMVGVSKATPTASGANENTPPGGDMAAQDDPAPNAGGADSSKEKHKTQASAADAQPEPGKASEPQASTAASAHPRGASRLNEPVINTETGDSPGSGEAAGRKA